MVQFETGRKTKNPSISTSEYRDSTRRISIQRCADAVARWLRSHLAEIPILLGLVLICCGPTEESKRTIVNVPSDESVDISSSSEKVMARVNGRQILQSELDGPIQAELRTLRQKIYELRRRRLDKLILKALLEQDSVRQNIGVNILTSRITKSVHVTSQEVEAAYREAVAQHGRPPQGEARARDGLRSILERIAWDRAVRNETRVLRADSQIEIWLDPPREIMLDIDGGGPTIGPVDAAVTMYLFSDYECPYCKEAQHTMRDVLNEHGGEVRLVHKFLPLKIHKHALEAARAAYCAQDQDRFWEYHDFLFAKNQWLERDALIDYANDLGLNVREFKECLSSPASESAISADVNEARNLGIVSTPTLLINGVVWIGPWTSEALGEIVDWEIERISPGSNCSGS